MNVIRSNTGDSNNPLRFFEDFFSEGFDKLYNDYFNFNTKKVTGTSDDDYCEEPYYMVECNKVEGYRIIEEAAFTNVEHEVTQSKTYFRDKLEDILKPQIDIAIRQTIDNIQPRDKDSQTTYIHTLFTQIEYIINNKLKYITNAKYQSQCKAYLVQYMREIVQRYSYLADADATYMKLLKEPVQNEFTTLLIVPHKQYLIPKLYDKLKPKFIEENTTLETFMKAFTGVQLKEGESLGIKWVFTAYGGCYLGALVKMLDYMIEIGCLSQYDDKQLSNIFVTNEGEYVMPSNWDKRRADANKPKERGEPLIFRELRGIVDTTIR